MNFFSSQQVGNMMINDNMKDLSSVSPYYPVEEYTSIELEAIDQSYNGIQYVF